MKIGSRSEGFTLVETLVVLAVTGFLFVIAAVVISGRQSKTEFSTGARDLQSRLQQVVNEVSSGFYPNNSSIKCVASGGVPVITTGGSPIGQGTNKDCIFLGKVIQFNADNLNPEQFDIYSVVGLRETSPGSGTLTTTVAQAKPRLITFNGSYDMVPMPFGMKTVSVQDKTNNASVGAVAFLGSLGSLDVQGPSQQVNVIAVSGTSPGTTMIPGGINTIQTNLPTSALSPTWTNPSKGVQWCVASGSTNQLAVYTIGGQGRQLTVGLAIKNGSVCP